MNVTLQEEGCLSPPRTNPTATSAASRSSVTGTIRVLSRFSCRVSATAWMRTLVSDKDRLDEPLLLCLQGTLEGWRFHRLDYGDRHSAGASGPDK
jgi:hypothetical protein